MQHVAMQVRTGVRENTRWIILLAIFGFSLAIHFWGLSRFNGLVFDEIYFPKYAGNYLAGTPLFDAHPPLGKYIIALGIRISEITGPLGSAVNSSIGGTPHAAWAYRWLDALAGSVLPLVFAGIAWQLTRRWKFVLLAALLTSLDGLFLVESRYGLINIFLLLFGLLGHYAYLRALNVQGVRRRFIWLAGAGVCLGACISVKWSGMTFIAIPWGLWIFASLHDVWLKKVSRKPGKTVEKVDVAVAGHPLQRAASVSFPTMLLTFIAIPLLVYALQWPPHLRINNTTFVDIQRQMFDYHRGVKDGPTEHPYCSRWSTWPLMQRPVSYLFTTRTPADPEPMAAALLPPSAITPTHAVIAMGNPILWWLAVPTTLLTFWIAMRAAYLASVGVSAVQSARRGRLQLRLRKTMRERSPLGADAWTAIYLAGGYAVSLLPWIGITRCSFIYHYMPSISFGFLACAFVLERMLGGPKSWRYLGAGLVLLIVAAFFYWLPIYLGLPVSMDEWYSRMWFKSWI